jgi:hypothetical protein
MTFDTPFDAILFVIKWDKESVEDLRDAIEFSRVSGYSDSLQTAIKRIAKETAADINDTDQKHFYHIATDARGWKLLAKFPTLETQVQLPSY